MIIDLLPKVLSLLKNTGNNSFSKFYTEHLYTKHPKPTSTLSADEILQDMSDAYEIPLSELKSKLQNFTPTEKLEYLSKKSQITTQDFISILKHIAPYSLSISSAYSLIKKLKHKGILSKVISNPSDDPQQNFKKILDKYSVSMDELMQHLTDINIRKSKIVTFKSGRDLIRTLQNIQLKKESIVISAFQYIDKLSSKNILTATFPFLSKNDLSKLNRIEILTIILLYYNISLDHFIAFTKNRGIKDIKDFHALLDQIQTHQRTDVNKSAFHTIPKLHSLPYVRHEDRIPYTKNIHPIIANCVKRRKKLFKENHIHFVFGTLTIVLAIASTITHLIIHLTRNKIPTLLRIRISIFMFATVAAALAVGTLLSVILELQFLAYHIKLARKRKSAIKAILGFTISSILLKLFPICNVIPVLISFSICIHKYRLTHSTQYIYIPAIVLLASLIICIIALSVLTCDLFIIVQPLVNLKHHNFDINKISKVNNLPYSNSINHHKIKYNSTTLDILYTSDTDLSNPDNQIVLYFPGQFNVPLQKDAADFLIRYNPKNTVIVTIKHPTLSNHFSIPSLRSWAKSGSQALQALHDGIPIKIDSGETIKLQYSTPENLHIISYSLGGLVMPNSLFPFLEKNCSKNQGEKPKFGSITMLSSATNIANMRGMPQYFLPLALQRKFRMTSASAFEKIKCYIDINTPIFMQHGTDEIYVPPTESINLYHKLQELGFKPHLEIIDNCNHEEMMTRTELHKAAFSNGKLEDHLIESKSI